MIVKVTDPLPPHSKQPYPQFALNAKGLPSIAEASAIVVAGRNARLLGARVATERATCAIATGDGR